MTRDELAGAFRRALAGDVGQIVSALYSYGRRLVDERAQRDDVPGAEEPGTSNRADVG